MFASLLLLDASRSISLLATFSFSHPRSSSLVLFPRTWRLWETWTWWLLAIVSTCGEESLCPSSSPPPHPHPLALLFPNQVDPPARFFLPHLPSLALRLRHITTSPVPHGHSNARYGKGCSMTASWVHRIEGRGCWRRWRCRRCLWSGKGGGRWKKVPTSLSKTGPPLDQAHDPSHEHARPRDRSCQALVPTNLVRLQGRMIVPPCSLPRCCDHAGITTACVLLLSLPCLLSCLSFSSYSPPPLRITWRKVPSVLS